MKLAGFGLETLTLLALALVIGIIVDDAIVDVENIQRHIDRGDPPHVAAIAATDEIGLTVTAATLTIVAVFLPVGLMGGVTGIFFRPFGLTISAAVMTSLLVARTLSPLLVGLVAPAGAVEGDGARSRAMVPLRRTATATCSRGRSSIAPRGAACAAVAGGGRRDHSADPEGIHSHDSTGATSWSSVDGAAGHVARLDQCDYLAGGGFRPAGSRCGGGVRGGGNGRGRPRPGDPARSRAGRERSVDPRRAGADPAPASCRSGEPT